MLGRRILVPLDGSPFGRHALPIAAEIARRVGGTLHLLAVRPPWPLTEMPSAPGPLMVAAEKSIDEGLQHGLDGDASELRAAGVDVDTELRAGVVDAEILDAAGAGGCDLIAMATHGRGGFQRAWLGSVADRVARHAHVPVLLVPAHRQPEGAEDEDAASVSGAGPRAADVARPVVGTDPEGAVRIRTIIVPLDGSTFSEQALAPATALGDAFDADYVLFRSIAPHVSVGSPYMAHAVHVQHDLMEQERAAARHALDAVADRFSDAGYTVTVALNEESEPVEALLRMVHGEPDAVIAMTSHGHGGIRRAVLGSTADKVIRGSRRPILLIRPDQDDPNEPDGPDGAEESADA